MGRCYKIQGRRWGERKWKRQELTRASLPVCTSFLLCVLALTFPGWSCPHRAHQPSTGLCCCCPCWRESADAPQETLGSASLPVKPTQTDKGSRAPCNSALHGISLAPLFAKCRGLQTPRAANPILYLGIPCALVKLMEWDQRRRKKPKRTTQHAPGNAHGRPVRVQGGLLRDTCVEYVTPTPLSPYLVQAEVVGVELRLCSCDIVFVHRGLGPGEVHRHLNVGPQTGVLRGAGICPTKPLKVPSDHLPKRRMDRSCCCCRNCLEAQGLCKTTRTRKGAHVFHRSSTWRAHVFHPSSTWRAHVFHRSSTWPYGVRLAFFASSVMPHASSFACRVATSSAGSLPPAPPEPPRSSRSSLLIT